MSEKEKISDQNPLPLAELGLGLAGASVVVIGVVFGLAAAFLAAAALGLGLVIYLVWQALSMLELEREEIELEEAFHLAVPSRAEEQKRALLRTLKDLEYELSVGKISQKDFDEVSKNVRLEAKQMIAFVDESLSEKQKEAERLYGEFRKTKGNEKS